MVHLVARAREEGSKPIGSGRRVWRESLILLIAPVLLYLLACLVSYHPDDPGFSHSGSVAGPIHNFGGVAGAHFADIVLSFLGIGAYALPFLLGYLVWLA